MQDASPSRVSRVSPPKLATKPAGLSPLARAGSQVMATTPAPKHVFVPKPAPHRLHTAQGPRGPGGGEQGGSNPSQGDELAAEGGIRRE